MNTNNTCSIIDKEFVKKWIKCDINYKYFDKFVDGFHNGKILSIHTDGNLIPICEICNFFTFEEERVFFSYKNKLFMCGDCYHDMDILKYPNMNKMTTTCINDTKCNKEFKIELMYGKNIYMFTYEQVCCSDVDDLIYTSTDVDEIISYISSKIHTY